MVPVLVPETVVRPVTVEEEPVVDALVEATGSELAVAVPVPLLKVAVVVAETELETVGATEKMGVSEKTWLMLPMLTAWMVYDPSAGTMGNVKVRVFNVASTLLAMAMALLKLGLVNSSEKVDGSPEVVVQLIVIVPPLVGLVGACRVRAETKGARNTKKLSLLNILIVVDL